jgi:vacuolar-type H+-ATPase subunit D/Vma8
MKMEDKVSMAIAALQRKEEKMAREREVHKTLTGLQDQVHTRVADLTAENATLKKELERVETQNERLLGYSVDDLSQAELFELIKSLTAAVERVRVTVLTKKIAVKSSPMGSKYMLLSSPEQRSSRAGVTMSLEEMHSKIESLKNYEGKKGRDEMVMKENDISMMSLEDHEDDED